MKWKIHFLLSPIHQRNTLMGFSITERTRVGTIENQANRGCWWVCEKCRLRWESKEAEGEGETNAVGQGNGNLWCQAGYLHNGQFSKSLGLWTEKLPKKDISECSFQGQSTESFQIPSVSKKKTKPKFPFRPSKADSLLCQCRVAQGCSWWHQGRDLEASPSSAQAALNPGRQRKWISAEWMAGIKGIAML